jgi:choline dehydrogenase
MIRAASPDPMQYPKIFCNYLSTEDDLSVAVNGLKKTREIMNSKALSKFTPKEELPGDHIQTDNNLINAARNLGTTIFHPVGTCKMGRADDPMAVLDSQLRVRGIHHLRVVDASAMPTITSGNTAAPTMMIAQRATELLTSE